MSRPILELEQVRYLYPDGTAALRDCSLTIRHGGRTALLGTNGAGKTTLFMHLNGLLQPSAGRVLHDGAPLDYSRNGLKSLRSRIGMVFQNPDSQLFAATAAEDVSFGPVNLGLGKETVELRVNEALRAVGMLEMHGKQVHNLSYGEKKRLCIAGVLAMKPDIMILDEPMAGLDAPIQHELTDILANLHSSGITTIIATHDLDFAYEWADDVIILDNGKLLAQGGAAEVLQRQDVQLALGSKPLVAEITAALSLIGIDLRDNGCIPRSSYELLRSIHALAKEEVVR